jgi:hypothetical protein
VKNQEGKARKSWRSTDRTLLSNFAINNSISAWTTCRCLSAKAPASDKRKSHSQSDYLSFCHEQLLGQEGALCLFGHHLGEQDGHLVEAIRRSKIKTLAISVFGRSDGFIQQQKRRFAALFEGMEVELRFFAARGHALGNPALAVPVEH